MALEASSPITRTLDDYIRTETLRAVYRQASLGGLLSLLAALVLAVGLWEVKSHTTLLSWLGGITLVSIMRLILMDAYRRGAHMSDHIVAWEHGFMYTLVAVSLVWGLGALWIMPASVTHEVLIYFFLTGLAGATVASYSAHPTACLVSLSSLVLPVTLWFAWHDVLELRVMAVGGALFLIGAIRATRNYGTFWQRTFRLSWELNEAHARAEQLARTDALTGINNRRAFTELGERALEQAWRYSRDLALVMFDIDRFKTINDTFGHAAGDRVLQAIGTEMRRLVRAPDIAGRLGGEEFALLLPETDGREAVAIAERLRTDLAGIAVPHDNTIIRFTCSFGVATRGPDADTLDVLLRHADAAMYRAKQEGRNRVIRADETTRDATP